MALIIAFILNFQGRNYQIISLYIAVIAGIYLFVKWRNKAYELVKEKHDD